MRCSPSPLVGEGAELGSALARQSEAGEGFFSIARDPSPGSRLRRSPPSPTRGEGKIVQAAPLSPIQRDGQNTKKPPPVLPDESSLPRKNIVLSEIRNACIFPVVPPRQEGR